MVLDKVCWVRRTSKRFENGSLRSREIPVTFRSQPKGVCKARGEEIKRRPKQRRTKKCMIKLLKERIHKKKNMGWESLLIYLSYKSTEWSTQTYKHVNDACTQGRQCAYTDNFDMILKGTKVGNTRFNQSQ